VSALVVKNFGEVSLTITAEAMLLRTRAIEKASKITAVTTAEEQATAVEAIAELKGLIKTMEASREDVKKPVLIFGRQIDAKAAEYKSDLETVAKHLNDMVQGFFREEAKKAAARQKFLDDMAEKKRQRESEEARVAAEEAERLRKEAQQAETVQDSLNLTAKAQEAEQLAEQAKERANDVGPAQVAGPVKVAGMTAKNVWKHEVIDINALYSARPELVKLEPKTALINAAISTCKIIPGLRIWEEIDTTVRAKY
jgi:hypothetical protein